MKAPPWNSGGFGPKRKAKDEPAARRVDFERSLCDAIGRKLLVAIRYDRDTIDRTFQPTAVYATTQGKVCVDGVQIANPNKPMDANEPRIFEVGKIISLSVTDIPFVLDARFDGSNERYRDGTICHV